MNTDTNAQVKEWEEFYQDVFGVKPDFSSLAIPEKQEGFDRLIIVAQGITAQRAYDKCAELFPSSSSVGDMKRMWQDRGAYAIWIRDRVEADEELKRVSVRELAVPGISLLGRLLYELKYFKETRKHLDRKNTTLCTGSCYYNYYDNLCVPTVCWSWNRCGSSRLDISSALYGVQNNGWWAYVRQVIL